MLSAPRIQDQDLLLDSAIIYRTTMGKDITRKNTSSAARTMFWFSGFGYSFFCVDFF